MATRPSTKFEQSARGFRAIIPYPDPRNPLEDLELKRPLDESPLLTLEVDADGSVSKLATPYLDFSGTVVDRPRTGGARLEFGGTGTLGGRLIEDGTGLAFTAGDGTSVEYHLDDVGLGIRIRAASAGEFVLPLLSPPPGAPGAGPWLDSWRMDPFEYLRVLQARIAGGPGAVWDGKGDVIPPEVAKKTEGITMIYNADQLSQATEPPYEDRDWRSIVARLGTELIPPAPPAAVAATYNPTHLFRYLCFTTNGQARVKPATFPGGLKGAEWRCRVTESSEVKIELRVLLPHIYFGKYRVEHGGLAGRDRRFSLVVPHDLDPGRPVRLITGLHGGVGGGFHQFLLGAGRNWNVAHVASMAALLDAVHFFPSLPVAFDPDAENAPNEDGVEWEEAKELALEDAWRTLHSYMEIDQDRLSLHGSSAGGARTYRIVGQSPNRWAAFATNIAPTNYQHNPAAWAVNLAPNYGTVPFVMAYGRKDLLIPPPYSGDPLHAILQLLGISGEKQTIYLGSNRPHYSPSSHYLYVDVVEGVHGGPSVDPMLTGLTQLLAHDPVREKRPRCAARRIPPPSTLNNRETKTMSHAWLTIEGLRDESQWTDCWAEWPTPNNLVINTDGNKNPALEKVIFHLEMHGSPKSTPPPVDWSPMKVSDNVSALTVDLSRGCPAAKVSEPFCPRPGFRVDVKTGAAGMKLRLLFDTTLWDPSWHVTLGGKALSCGNEYELAPEGLVFAGLPVGQSTIQVV